MSLLTLCSDSRFINILVKNGYDDTLSTLLRDLDINETTDNVTTLIIYGKLKYSNIYNKIGVEHAITICDELCARYNVNHIVQQNILLDKLLEHQIINSYINDEIVVYNNGYRIISEKNIRVTYRDEKLLITNATLINNAHNNGLYAPYVHLDINLNFISNKNIMQCVLDDIRVIYRPSLNIAALCKNAEEIIQLTDYNSAMLPFAKNIKKISLSFLNTNYVQDLDQFTQLRELATNGRMLQLGLQLPSTLNILNLDDTYANNHNIKMCTRLKKLITYTSNITSCDHFAAHLVILNAHGIGDYGLRLCTSITELYARHNYGITTCAPFAHSLRKLSIPFGSGIRNEGLRLCMSITDLNVSCNPRAISCDPFANTLRILDVSWRIHRITHGMVYYKSCGTGDEELRLCRSLTYLDARDNRRITNKDKYMMKPSPQQHVPMLMRKRIKA